MTGHVRLCSLSNIPQIAVLYTRQYSNSVQWQGKQSVCVVLFATWDAGSYICGSELKSSSKQIVFMLLCLTLMPLRLISITNYWLINLLRSAVSAALSNLRSLPSAFTEKQQKKNYLILFCSYSAFNNRHGHKSALQKSRQNQFLLPEQPQFFMLLIP